MTAEAQRRRSTKADHFQRIGYDPHEGQRQVHASRARHRVTRWGRRAGKTMAGAMEVTPWANAVNWRGKPPRGWVVGPQFTDCEKEFRIIYDTLRKLGVDRHSIKFLNNVESGNMHILTSWGFDVACRSAKHPETLVGEGLDFVVMAEAGRHKWKTWTEYIRPALSDMRGWSLHSGVPEGASYNSLLYQLHSRGQSSEFQEWASWKFPSWVNLHVFPGGRNDPEIKAAEIDLTRDEFQRQYEAEFVEKSGAVMKEWDDDVHLADLSYDPSLPLYGCVDYGYTNPFVWLWVQVDHGGRLTRRRRVHVLAEHSWTHRDTEEIAQDLKEHPYASKMVQFFPDPAEPDDTRILERHLRRQASGGTGGLRSLRDAAIRRALKHDPDNLGEFPPELFVDRNRCPRLAWECREGYRWPEKTSEIRNDSEQPLDKDNHAVEALGRIYAGLLGVADRNAGEPVAKARVSRGKANRR